MANPFDAVEFAPNVWQGLETLAKYHNEIDPNDFMFMGYANIGNDLAQYKHRNTRRYLILDKQGNCYKATPYTTNRNWYVEIRDSEAVRYVLG
jgi:hypothetical protein